ncbi:MAG: COX15/CtaA family protein [Planctomycetota bacterium]
MATTSANGVKRPGLGLRLVMALLVLGLFGLVGVGGVVTSYDAGMDVPDWPGTFGHQMIIAPLELWIKDPVTGRYFHGAFWEHFHRLVGTLVGVLAIIAAVVVARTQRHRPWLVWATIGMLGLIIVQGLKGGLRVSENSIKLAGVHGVVGQLILAFGVFLLVALSMTWWRATQGSVPTDEDSEQPQPNRLKWWELGVLVGCVVVALSPMFIAGRDTEGLIMWGYEQVLAVCVPPLVLYGVLVVWRMRGHVASAWKRVSRRGFKAGTGVMRWAAVAMLVMVCVQLILGAAVRHAKADRAIPDAPLVYGSVIPPTDAAVLAEKVAAVPLTYTVNNATLGMVWLQYVHRVGAMITLVVMLGLFALVIRKAGEKAEAVMPTLGLLMITGVQIMLGIMTVWSETHPIIASGHQAVGAFLLAVAVVVLCRVWLVSLTEVELAEQACGVDAISGAETAADGSSESGASPQGRPEREGVLV